MPDAYLTYCPSFLYVSSCTPPSQRCFVDCGRTPVITMRNIALIITSGLLLAAAPGPVSAQSANETGEHPGWPRWCGKVYKTGYPSFEPGGHTTEPPATNSTNLYVQFKPRYSIYLSGEGTASFVVNAALSPWFGEPYDATATASSDGASTATLAELAFSIKLVADDRSLVEDRITVNATGVEFEFELAGLGLEPRTEPYEVAFLGTSEPGGQNYTAESSFLYLPDNPEDSATKIDHLNGGLLFKNPQTGNEWTPLLPYGYYGLYNGSNDTAEADGFVREYTSNGEGLNAIISLAGFADTNPVYESMDAGGLHFMFDLRSSYKNLTEVETRVNVAKHHTSLFAYWTADEPDGWQVPFATTPAAQSLIHTLDPYHPVAVTLNCLDYYFGPYSAGADILMADPYPIGINTTLSKWGTTCNATLGDCGCDGCAGGVRDVVTRWDALARYETRLGRWPLPRMHNPQAFHGEDYWARDPSAGEARAMNALAFHRGVSGVFAWTWPSSAELFAAHSDMAAVVTRPPVRDFLLGARPRALGVEGREGVVDAAYWVRGTRALVSVVNSEYADIETLSIALPVAATGVAAVPFGGLSWRLVDGKLAVDVLPAMSVSFVVLELGAGS
ncbi:hypothetical protein F5B20DRAFT_547077 [Whalleya microplaca]|nr:hypothetical protein F5B20DRAFT_547077 [Whalleya microplaca]